MVAWSILPPPSSGPAQIHLCPAHSMASTAQGKTAKVNREVSSPHPGGNSQAIPAYSFLAPRWQLPRCPWVPLLFWKPGCCALWASSARGGDKLGLCYETWKIKMEGRTKKGTLASRGLIPTGCCPLQECSHPQMDEPPMMSLYKRKSLTTKKHRLSTRTAT